MPNLLPFVVMGAIMVAFLTFINIDFAFVVLIFSMLLSPAFNAGSVPGGRAIAIRAEDILIIVIFLSWFAKKVMHQELGLLRPNRLNGPIIGYIIVAIVATLWGIIAAKVVPMRGAFFLLKYIEYFMLFFMVTNSVTNKRQIKMYIFFMLLTALITSVYAIATLPQYGRASAPFENVATGGEPNTLGGYLILICSLALGIWVYSSNMFVSGALIALIAYCGYTLLQTLSRGSYLGFIVMYLAMAVLATRKKAVLMGIVVLSLLFGVTFLPKNVINRVQETFVPDRVYEPLQGVKIRLDESASARVETWKTIYTKWQYSPVLGYGVSGAGFIDSQYPLVLGETGIVGLLMFLLLMSTLLQEGLRIFREMPDDYTKGVALGFLAGFIGLLMHSFSAATFIIIRIMEPFWFLAAILVALPRVLEEERNPACIYPVSEQNPR